MNPWVVAGPAALAGAWLGSAALAHVVVTRGNRFVIHRGRHPSAVALTFDDGPNPPHTQRICDILESHGAKGTFFVLGRQVDRYPEALGATVERGHEVQLHGHNHLHAWFTPPWLHQADLRRGLEAVERASGTRPVYVRPPWGMCSASGLWIYRRLGLRPVRWSVCPEGFWVKPSVETMVEHIMGRIRGGDIVCLHDAGGFDDTPERVAACLELVLPRLAERGLEATTLSRCIEGI